ncbi:hypothetical protein SLE2022_299420 [Rubroshorea leprosula]
MLVSSGGDVYQSNWARACDTCKAAACTLYCHTDSAYFCNDCDQRIHAANSSALTHQRVWVCTASENAPAAVTCKADAASLCFTCDAEIHSVNALARRQSRIPIPPFSGLAYASSCSYTDDDLPGTVLDPHNEIMANTTTSEEIDEDEAYSWLLLEPENDENQANSGFTFSEPVDEYMDLRDSCTGYQHRGTYSQLQSSSTCLDENGSDGVVPEKYFDMKKQNINFNKEQEASRTAFINTPTSSQDVPMSFVAAGMLPNTPRNSIPSSYFIFQNEATDFFPNPSLLMPLQFMPMNREEKVLRYREKRKARKFEKKIRYASRKAYAETRPRVKGRFAREIDLEIDEDHIFSKECGYRVVPTF